MENINEKYELMQHITRVSDLAYKMAKFMGLEELECREIAIAGHLHDVGKLMLHPDILNKKGKLTSEEKSYIEDHVKYSFMMAYAFENKLSANIIRMIKEHHENYDGTGYPDKKAGSELLLGSLIIKTCDVYDAMRSDRPYRVSLSQGEALAEMMKESHKYDPKCLVALAQLTKESEYKEAI